MTKSLHGEIWKPVQLPENIITSNRMEVSNYGRVRSFNKNSDGNIVKGSHVGGYPIIRLKFFTAKIEEDENAINIMRQEIAVLQQHFRSAENAEVKKKAEDAFLFAKKKFQKKYNAFLKKRTINYQALVHRLVAAAFLPKPAPEQKFIAHTDLDKENNRASNLKWLSQAEHITQRKKYPSVIKQLSERKHSQELLSTAKLSVTKVMLLKKLLEDNVPLARLAKQFKITATQILRIKRGENWKNVAAYSKTSGSNSGE